VVYVYFMTAKNKESEWVTVAMKSSHKKMAILVTRKTGMKLYRYLGALIEKDCEARGMLHIRSTEAAK